MPLFRRKEVLRVSSSESDNSNDEHDHDREPSVHLEPKTESPDSLIIQLNQRSPSYSDESPKRSLVISPPRSSRKFFSPTASVLAEEPGRCGHDKHCCSWWEHTVAILSDFCRLEIKILCPFVLIFILFIYTFVGAVVMWVMERHYTMFFWDPDYSQQDAILEQLWHDRMTVSKDVWKASVTKMYLRWNRESNNLDHLMGWSFLEAFFYSLGVCCASHASHLEPRTIGGKIFTVVFATVGIPLYLLAAMEVGRLVARLFCFVTRIFITSIQWLISMATGKSCCKKPSSDTSKAFDLCKFNCKMAICMAALYTVVGGSFVFGSTHSSFIDFFYYSFIACACIEIGEVFHYSSLVMPYILFQIAGMAVFSVMFEVIQMELCNRIPCTTKQLCQRLKEQAWFWDQTSFTPADVSYEKVQVKPTSSSSSQAATISSSASRSSSLSSSFSADRGLVSARMDVTKVRKKPVSPPPSPHSPPHPPILPPSPKPEKPVKKRFFKFRHQNVNDRQAGTRESV